jgi:hypothetical protein
MSYTKRDKPQCVLQSMALDGWVTLRDFGLMTEATSHVKELSKDLTIRLQFRLLDHETMEPISYFDTLGSIVLASSVGRHVMHDPGPVLSNDHCGHY